jgi:transcriptional regulator with PAS, ATPase and Fis domain
MLKTVDIRIISATNRDLHTMVQNGTFRRDLYHRLKVIEIEMPPLRERGEDILPLLYYYIDLFDRQFGRHHQLDRKTVDLLLSYEWPGNIRELKHTVEYLTAMVENGKILPEHLPVNICAVADPSVIPFPDPAAVGFDGALDEFTRRLILTAQKKYKSSYKVARALNISQSKASRLIRRHMPEG